MKWPWWREEGLIGRLTVEGRRLDASAPPMRSHIPGGYGETGFQASTLIWPAEGCWEVTGRAGPATLTFVILVVKVGDHPTLTPTPTSSPTAVAITDASPLAPPVPLPGTGSRAFQETSKTVTGIFLDYWRNNGGLTQQGYPISEVMGESSDLDGKVYTVQYFERAVFEYHPENAGTEYEVLLSQLGTFQYKRKYGVQGPANQKPNTSPGSITVPQTGKRIGGKFLDYWKMHGGLHQHGYPISDEFTEVSELDGKSYTVQYFERAVFELHPENAGTPHEVLLSHLGTSRYKQRYGGR